MASTSQTTGEGGAGRNCKPVSGVRRLPGRDAVQDGTAMCCVESGLCVRQVLAILSGVITVMWDTKVESFVRVLHILQAGGPRAVRGYLSTISESHKR
jgi:hypothetical protein